jgi:hypothetical protein
VLLVSLLSIQEHSLPYFHCRRRRQEKMQLQPNSSCLLLAVWLLFVISAYLETKDQMVVSMLTDHH